MAINHTLKNFVVSRILSTVQTPAQYVGGELNIVVKDHRSVRGKLCLAFPDTYTIGMSHHGLQVLYTLMNDRADWACERAFTPVARHGAAAARARRCRSTAWKPSRRCASSTCSASRCNTRSATRNVLTMLDLGGIPLRGDDRTMDHPLVIAGGPCAQNPEPLAPFIDLFVIGDGEPSLPVVCDEWLRLKDECRQAAAWPSGDAGRQQREEMLAELAAQLPFAYVPRFYEPEYYADGRLAAMQPHAADVPDDDRAVGHRRFRRHPAADRADRAVRRVRARPDRHRDHARLPVAVPLLPEHGHQAAAAGSQVETIVAGGAGELPQHGLQRDLAAVALDQRLSVLRGAGAADAGGVPAAGREHLAAEPAGQRAACRAWPS